MLIQKPRIRASKTSFSTPSGPSSTPPPSPPPHTHTYTRTYPPMYYSKLFLLIVPSQIFCCTPTIFGCWLLQLCCFILLLHVLHHFFFQYHKRLCFAHVPFSENCLRGLCENLRPRTGSVIITLSPLVATFIVG